MSKILGGVMVPHPPLIIPNVGRGDEEKISDTVKAYKEVSLKIKELEPDTIILISPHSSSSYDMFNIHTGSGMDGDFSRFGAGDVLIHADYDEEVVGEIIKTLDDVSISYKKINEEVADHGVMIPLFFLNEVYSNYKIVRLSLSGGSSVKHYEFGKAIQKALSLFDKKFFVIASGDLSHRLKDDGPYGFHEDGPIYDEMVMKDMESSSFMNLFDYSSEFLDNAAICGHKGFCIMAGIFDGYNVIGKKYSYEGPFGVGYGVCSYDVLGVDDSRYLLDLWKKKKTLEIKENNEDEYIALARKSINSYVRDGCVIDTLGVSDELLNNKAGVFVSIHKEGCLRGCIGTISSVYENVALEIIHNAISAATRDFRFSPITVDELDFLEISVDVLKEAEEISSIDELDIKKYGVIVSTDTKRGLLLPNLDNVNSVDEQVSIAMRKGNINKNDDYKLERFEVVRHEVRK